MLSLDVVSLIFQYTPVRYVVGSHPCLFSHLASAEPLVNNYCYKVSLHWAVSLTSLCCVWMCTCRWLERVPCVGVSICVSYLQGPLPIAWSLPIYSLNNALHECTLSVATEKKVLFNPHPCRWKDREVEKGDLGRFVSAVLSWRSHLWVWSLDVAEKEKQRASISLT